MEFSLPSVEDQESSLQLAERALKGIVNTHFPKGDEDHKAFRLMVKKLMPKLRNCPASGTIKYHSAWAGGMLVHTTTVIQCALQIAETLGPDIHCVEERDAFLRSLVKVAYIHDIGKIGNLEDSYYVEQDNEWRREKLGETYTINRDLTYLPIPVRGVWLAQRLNVQLTEAETQAIIASDGPGTPHGKAVISTFLETPLTMILHFADKWVSQVRGV